MALAPNGLAQRFDIVDRDLSLLGGYAEERGLAFVVGRLSRPVGVLIEILRVSVPVVRTVEDTARLHGVARATGGALIVCGTHGSLLAIDDDEEPREIPWGSTGHLYAIAAAQDGG